MLFYRLTIFLAAFLLFAVQLLMGKYVLPWFGGTPAVWTTCMLFFQALLLAGYAYAHALTGRLSPRAQGALHATLALASLLLLGALALVWDSPITPGAGWKPHGSDDPIRGIVGLLAAGVGLPYLVLSATAPLLQAWMRRTHPENSPYRLYALSNLGSFLALWSYPFVVEPWLALKTQARLWSWGYAAFALGCGYCALRIRRHTASEVDRADDGNDVEVTRPGKGTHALWLSLAACASVMFLATTNQMCQDIAVVPFLWVLPLSLYLLSFIICFERDRWYSRRWFHPAFGLGVFLACFVLYEGALGSIFAQIGVYSFALFTCCMVCHGELARLRPASRYLTSFYLMVATGGAAGGVFVALLAPRLFRGLWEYPLALWGSALLVLLILARDEDSWFYQSSVGAPVLIAVAVLLPESIALASPSRSPLVHFPLFVALVLALRALIRGRPTGFSRVQAWTAKVYATALLAILGAVLYGSAAVHAQNAVALSRNFYGALAVFQQNAYEPDWRAYALIHGRTVHGIQFRDEAKRLLPTAYFGSTSGVGLALLHHPRRSAAQPSQSNLRIGVAGLGIGTLAAYGRAGDCVRFYEINPEVIRLATDPRYFSYLERSPARIELIPGDARLSLEKELERNETQQFDLLAIDAFTGDAIPTHLLTEEAFGIYLKHLRPGGILALNVTNRYLDLKPVLWRAAERFGLRSAWIHGNKEGRMAGESDWMLLSEDGEFLNSPAILKAGGPRDAHLPAARLWTDDYSNLFQALKK